MALQRIGVRAGEVKRSIMCLSFLMAMYSPSVFEVLSSVKRATGRATWLGIGSHLQMLVSEKPATALAATTAGQFWLAGIGK